MHNSYKVPEVSVVLDDWVAVLAHSGRERQTKLQGARLTLMSHPFALFDRLGPSTQCHEIAFDNVLDVLRIQPEGYRAGEVI